MPTPFSSTIALWTIDLDTQTDGSRLVQKPFSAGRIAVLAAGRVVCGAKRIRSLYLPLGGEKLPGLSTTSPPRGLASVFTINAATMRLCRADLPAAYPIAAGSLSHSVHNAG
jgi:hypothetical protein